MTACLTPAEQLLHLLRHAPAGKYHHGLLCRQQGPLLDLHKQQPYRELPCDLHLQSGGTACSRQRVPSVSAVSVTAARRPGLLTAQVQCWAVLTGLFEGKQLFLQPCRALGALERHRQFRATMRLLSTRACQPQSPPAQPPLAACAAAQAGSARPCGTAPRSPGWRAQRHAA